MNHIDVSGMSEKIQQFFGPVAQSVARETGFVQRESNMTGPLFCQTMVFGLMKNVEASLTDLAVLCHEIEPSVSISPQGLDQRMNEAAVEFLSQMWRQSLERFKEKHRVEMELLSHVGQVNIVDSSGISLPESLRQEFPGTGGSASEAGVKVQVMLEVLSGQYQVIELEPGRRPDQSYGPRVVQQVSPGSLTITD